MQTIIFKKNRKSGAGFIALISAIIIAFMLIVISVTLGATSFFGRINILDTESKERSLALAEACVDKAISSIALDFTFPNNLEIDVTSNPQDKCTIVSTEKDQPVGGQTRIKVTSNVNKAYSNLIVVIDNDYEIVSWEEVSNL